MEEKQPGESYKNIFRSLRKMLFYNFLGGIAWSLGTLVGLGIIVAIIGYIISQINLVPIIGSWVAEILKEVTSKTQLPGSTMR